MATQTPARPVSVGRTVLRSVLSLAALAVVAGWAFFAWFVLVFRCDESCSGNQAESWVYPGQAVLAGCGVVLALVAVVLGFTTRRQGYRAAATAWAVALVVWLTWLFMGGF